MVQKVSKWDYGAQSPEWMAKALVRHMDRSSLDTAVCFLIDHISEEGEIDHEDFLQILVQVSATHKWVKTFDPYDSDETITPDEDDEAENNGLPTKHEVDTWWADFQIEQGLRAKKESEDKDDDSDN